MGKNRYPKRGQVSGSAIKQTRQRKQQRGRKQQRQRWLTALLAISAGLVLLVALFVFGNQPATGEIPAEAMERYVDIPQGTTIEGFPTLGSESAHVSLKLFTSFDCSHCAEQGNLINQLIPRLTQGTEISLQFIPIIASRMLELQNAEFATKFALCAGRYDRFWEYQEAVYSWQKFGQRAYSSARLADGIQNLGLTRTEVEECVRGQGVNAIIDAALAAAEAQLGFSQYGFPLFAVNLEPITPNSPGELPMFEQIQSALDAAIDAIGEEEVEETVTESGETEEKLRTPVPTATLIVGTEVPAIPAPGTGATATEVPIDATAEENESD